ncbi:hypothetical protein [Gordonia sputi]|uniref:hypothetical protein n=1 Tax=Gordonia sputi TaxID=36823 RepID=UPI0036A70CBC
MDCAGGDSGNRIVLHRLPAHRQVRADIRDVPAEHDDRSVVTAQPPAGRCATAAPPTAASTITPIPPGAGRPSSVRNHDPERIFPVTAELVPTMSTTPKIASGICARNATSGSASATELSRPAQAPAAPA